MFVGRFRLLVSVSAALPISSTDGEVVYNFRGSLRTANLLGQLFRILGQAFSLGQQNTQQGKQKNNFLEIF